GKCGSRSKLPPHVYQVVILIEQNIIQIRRRSVAPLVAARNKGADRCTHAVIDQPALSSTAADSAEGSGYHGDQRGQRGAGRPKPTRTFMVFPYFDVDFIAGIYLQTLRWADLIGLVHSDYLAAPGGMVRRDEGDNI